MSVAGRFRMCVRDVQVCKDGCGGKGNGIIVGMYGCHTLVRESRSKWEP